MNSYLFSFMEIILCGMNYILWALPLFLFLVLLHRITEIKDFIFRKLLHITAFSGIVFLMEKGEDFLLIGICLIIGAFSTYLILSLAEHLPCYTGFFLEKKPFEVKRNLFGVFLISAILTFVFGGIFHQLHFAAVIIILWGFGDAFAALIGIPFGKHKINIHKKDKSLEGTLAFIVFGFASAFIFVLLFAPELFLLHTFIPFLCLLSVCGALTEVFSKEAWDNIIVPFILGGICSIYLCLI